MHHRMVRCGSFLLCCSFFDDDRTHHRAHDEQRECRHATRCQHERRAKFVRRVSVFIHVPTFAAFIGHTYSKQTRLGQAAVRRLPAYLSLLLITRIYCNFLLYKQHAHGYLHTQFSGWFLSFDKANAHSVNDLTFGRCFVSYTVMIVELEKSSSIKHVHCAFAQNAVSLRLFVVPRSSVTYARKCVRFPSSKHLSILRFVHQKVFL